MEWISTSGWFRIVSPSPWSLISCCESWRTTCTECKSKHSRNARTLSWLAQQPDAREQHFLVWPHVTCRTGWVSIWHHVAFFWNLGWHVNAVAVWILGPLSPAATCQIGGLLTIPYQFHAYLFIDLLIDFLIDWFIFYSLIYWFVDRFIYLFIDLLIDTIIYLLFIYLFLCLFIYLILFIYLFFYSFIYFYVYLFIIYFYVF
jgi:hypothetical protein